MIIEGLFNCIFTFILFLFDMLPNSTLAYDNHIWVNTLLETLAYFNSFVGNDIFLVAAGHAIFFWTAEIIWSVTEWIYKKIPGVD